MKPGSKIYKKCLQHPIRHEVDPISSSESSGELSDASRSSVESYHPQQKKMKDINMNRNDNVYNIVYGNEDAKSEDDLGESEISEDENANADSVDENADVVDAPDFDKKLSQVFDQYETWLRTADGGRKSDQSALQCRRQVELVVSYIDSSNQSLECILDKNRLRDEWLVKFEKEKQPGTVKSYLGTLCNFYAFLKCENFDVGVSVDHLSSLSQQVKLWARSFRKNSMNRFWEKRMEDISTMRTPEQVKTFDTSEVARAAITILGEYKGKEEEISPTQPDYTSVRDYLLTVLCINNGSRSGTLANMTLREFRQATKEDDCFIVRVKDHKTFTTHGPVSVIFTASLYSYTQIFIEKLRNHLEGVSTDGDSAVFLSVTLKKMTSSHVGSQIGSCWGKVFGKEAVLGGATAFRKAAVSAVNEHNEDMCGDLANLMVHKQSTADRYYLLQSKGKSAVKTSKELTRIMRSSGVEDDETAEKESKASGRDGSESRRHKWTSAEIAELETAFSSNIDSRSITMEQVKKTVKRIPALRSISPEKIRDKIRSYFRENDGENSGFLLLPAEKESLGDRLNRAGLEKQKNDDGTCKSITIRKWCLFEIILCAYKLCTLVSLSSYSISYNRTSMLKRGSCA
jgi:site-specific recombinase XerD